MQNWFEEKMRSYVSMFLNTDADTGKENIIVYVGKKNNGTEEEYNTIKRNINFMLDVNRDRLMDTVDRDVYLYSFSPLFIAIVKKDGVGYE